MGHRDSKHWLQGYSGIVESSELGDLQENETLVKENETYRIKLETAMEEAEKVHEAVVTEAREEMEDDHDEIEFLTRTNADLASQNDRLSKDLEVCRAKLDFAEGAAEEVVGMTSSIQATLSYLQKDVSEGCMPSMVWRWRRQTVDNHL